MSLLISPDFILLNLSAIILWWYPSMKSGHMALTKVIKSVRIFLCFCFLSNWTRYRLYWRLVSGGRFSKSCCNNFFISISCISTLMGVKMIFTLDNHLNQGIKQKVVGPLLKQSDSTYDWFTFSGSGLVPLLIPKKNSRCSCMIHNRVLLPQPVVDPGVWHICHMCVYLYNTLDIVPPKMGDPKWT
jgi:hypothetical protein